MITFINLHSDLDLGDSGGLVDMWSSCPAWVAVIPDDIGSDGVKSSAGFSFNIVADSPAGPETGDNLKFT